MNDIVRKYIEQALTERLLEVYPNHEAVRAMVFIASMKHNAQGVSRATLLRAIELAAIAAAEGAR